MLNEVKVFDSTGKYKKVLSKEEVSKAYWSKLRSSQTNSIPMKIGKGKRFNKKKLLEEFDYHIDELLEMRESAE